MPCNLITPKYLQMPVKTVQSLFGRYRLILAQMDRIIISPGMQSRRVFAEQGSGILAGDGIHLPVIW